MLDLFLILLAYAVLIAIAAPPTGPAGKSQHDLEVEARNRLTTTEDTDR